MLFPAALISHRQSTFPNILLGFALYVSPLSFTETFVFSVIPSKTPNIVRHYRISQVPSSQTQRQYFYSLQTQSFFPEISAVRSEKPLPVNCRIKPLMPYICPNGFLRVHGSLEKSRLNQNIARTVLWFATHPSCSSANFLDNIRSLRHSSRHNALLILPPSTCL